MLHYTSYPKYTTALLTVIIYQADIFFCDATKRTLIWTPDNPIFFRESYQKNHLVVRLGDVLRIECPPIIGDPTIFYWVDKPHADACELPSQSNGLSVGKKFIGRCTSDKHWPVPITFRMFSPTPGGHEFRAGKTYHIISTSTGDHSMAGLENAKGGLCESHNMKLHVTVLRKLRHYNHHRQVQDDRVANSAARRTLLHHYPDVVWSSNSLNADGFLQDNPSHTPETAHHARQLMYKVDYDYETAVNRSAKSTTSISLVIITLLLSFIVHFIQISR